MKLNPSGTDRYLPQWKKSQSRWAKNPEYRAECKEPPAIPKRKQLSSGEGRVTLVLGTWLHRGIIRLYKHPSQR